MLLKHARLLVDTRNVIARYRSVACENVIMA
jgi:hypothetical protein